MSCHAARAFLATALALLAPFAAGAAEPTPWFIGAALGAGRGRVDCLDDFRCDRADTSYSLYGGWRIDSHLEVRATGLHLGGLHGADVAPLGTRFGGGFRVDGIALTAGWRQALGDRLSAAVRAGAAVNRTRFVYDDPAYGGARSKSVVQPSAGAGIACAITPAWAVGLDVDATRFKAYRSYGSLRTLAVSVQYAF